MTTIAEYLEFGRYFQSIEIHEGEGITKTVHLVGPDILMYASDYPQGEAWLPDTVSSFLGWSSIPNDVKKKMLWDNALRCFPRFPANIAAPGS